MTDEAAPLVLDLGAVAHTVRRRLAVIVGGLLLGGVTAAGILLFVPARFDGRAMVLVRTAADPSSLIKKGMGSIGDLLPSGLGGALGGDDQELATELSLLVSRAVLGTVVDSLRLQVVPRSPDRIPPAQLVDSVRNVARFKPVKVPIAAGRNAFPSVIVWAKSRADVKLFDREDAIDELADRLTVKKAGGNTVEIRYRARDSVTAADVPNLVAAIYMLRRKTVDRGLNQRRLEFLTATADSVRTDLRSSADVLARVAEQNQVGATPEIAGKALADEVGLLEARQSELRAGAHALDSLLDAVRVRHVDARTLAGFPDLLRSPAINDLISQIAQVETQRTVLLGRVPEGSPQAVALARAKDSLVAQLVPIATAYRGSLERQDASVSHDLAAVQAQISGLPKQSAQVAKEQVEVTRLSQMNAGMGAQVLEARLAALAEGGDVRVIDAAVVARRPAFPRPATTIAICLVGGLLAGLVVALTGMPQTVFVLQPGD